MIINSTSDIRLFVPIKDKMSWDAIKPFVEFAEQKYLVPLIGENQYNIIDRLASGTGSDSGSQDQEDKETKLLHLCRRAIANLAMWNGFALLTVQWGDKGAQRVEDGSNKSLYKYQEEELKEQLKNAGHNAIDEILAYLETDIEYFPDFESHETYTNLQSAIIRNTAEFDSIFHINNSRLVFLRMSRFMKVCIDLDLIPTIGKVVYDKIIDEIKKPQPDIKVSTLLHWLKPALIYYSLARGIKDIGVNITDRMVYFEGQESTQNNSSTKIPASDIQVLTRSQEMKLTGDQYMEPVKKQLTDNAEYFGYTVVTTPTYKRDNTDKKTVWL